MDGHFELLELFIVDFLLLLSENLVHLRLDIFDLVLFLRDLRYELSDVVQAGLLALLLNLSLEIGLLLLIDLLPLGALLLQFLLEVFALILALAQLVVQVGDPLLVLASVVEAEHTLLDVNLVLKRLGFVLQSLQLLLGESKVANALARHLGLLADLDLELLHLARDVALLLLLVLLEFAEALLHL